MCCGEVGIIVDANAGDGSLTYTAMVTNAERRNARGGGENVTEQTENVSGRDKSSNTSAGARISVTDISVGWLLLYLPTPILGVIYYHIHRHQS